MQSANYEAEKFQIKCGEHRLNLNNTSKLDEFADEQTQVNQNNLTRINTEPS